MKETSLGRPSCVTKRRPPLSHMISLFIKDTATSEPQPAQLVSNPTFQKLGGGGLCPTSSVSRQDGAGERQTTSPVLQCGRKGLGMGLEL
jgi:hypothetical protein